jgi:hypothetical protein
MFWTAISRHNEHYIYISFLSLPLWSTGHPWNTTLHLGFLILRQSVRLLGRGMSPSHGHNLHRTTQSQNKSRQTSLPSVRFQPKIPVFERAKTVHALNRGTTVVGMLEYQYYYIPFFLNSLLIYCIHFITFATIIPPKGTGDSFPGDKADGVLS